MKSVNVRNLTVAFVAVGAIAASVVWGDRDIGWQVRHELASLKIGKYGLSKLNAITDGIVLLRSADWRKAPKVKQ
jgi:hypothetical protein